MPTPLALLSRSIDTLREYEAAYERLDPGLQVRVDLAVAHRWAARWHWNEGVVNHLTAVVPGFQDRFFAIPYGVHWDEVKARDFVVVDLDGRLIEGDGEIELTSLLIHGAMHRDLPQAQVVLHTHQANITAFTSMSDQTIQMCSQHALQFAGRIAYMDRYGLATERSIGDLIREAIRDKDILLMANHGVTVCGPTVHEAFGDLYTLDRACQIQWMALASGHPLRIIDPREVALMADSAQTKAVEEGEQHFRALRRILWRQEPDLAGL